MQKLQDKFLRFSCLQNRTFDVRIVHGRHSVGKGGGDGQTVIRQHIHQNEHPVGNAVKNVDLSVVVFHNIIAQPSDFARYRLELHLRLIGIEAVVGHQYWS